MNAPLIEARGLGKSYPKVHRNADRLRALGRLLLRGSDPDRVAVLRDVDLSVRRGESLGLIGANGAGKSTLLKLVTGVLTPTTGRVQVNGTIGALLELGAGFHPEYSGRDNVVMAAALHGLSGAELQARLPEIIAFADIGAYIDEPVKHYSSGMVVRLGFAVIAALKPDLLVTDEVLAVGDESFQKKCIRWMQDYLDGGGTLILVSHSMYHVQKLCRHALWLRDGAVAEYGDVFDVTQAYLAWHERKSAPAAEPAAARGEGEFGMLGLALNGEDGERGVVLEGGATLRVHARVRSRDGRVPSVVIGLVRADGTPVYGVGTDMDGCAPVRVAADEYACELQFDDLALLPGNYLVRAHPLDPEGLRLFDTLERGVAVRGASREFGLVRLAHRWNPLAEEAPTP
ncbi:MAG: ABC transporter ATP-binding protein [Rhodanobacteraceae bacterium]|nr:ABC transporter ATP-binding protein [Rhodanobacteraceae bacterium]